MNKLKTFLIIPYFLLGLTACTTKKPDPAPGSTKLQLLALERNWLEAEFRLDTGYIAPMIADSFMGISEEGIHNKEQLLESMYSTISQRLADSIVVERFRLENEEVRIHENTAVVTFIVHTFKKNKGVPEEKKTRFYDVWIKQDDTWKMLASQGSPVADK